MDREIDTEARLMAEHPKADRPDLFMVRREWMGRRVAVRYTKRRGHSRQRTSMGWAWGVLVPAERDDNIAVRTKDGVKAIHYTRVQHVFDLTRHLCAKNLPGIEGANQMWWNRCNKPRGHQGECEHVWTERKPRRSNR